jgi:hydrogenase maturation protein HypF
VSALRERKYREDKPFALMARTIETVSEYCFVSEDERELLLSPARPIVLLERKTNASIPDAVAPGVNHSASCCRIRRYTICCLRL